MNFIFWLRHKHLILRLRQYWKNEFDMTGEQGFICMKCGREY